MLSKMAFMAEVWGRASKDALKPARLLFNNMFRYAQGGSLFTGLDFERALLGWRNFMSGCWANARRCFRTSYGRRVRYACARLCAQSGRDGRGSATVIGARCLKTRRCQWWSSSLIRARRITLAVCEVPSSKKGSTTIQTKTSVRAERLRRRRRCSDGDKGCKTSEDRQGARSRRAASMRLSRLWLRSTPQTTCS